VSGGAASTGSPTGSADDPADGAGFLVLGLAQMVCIFAFWLAVWPAAFGLSRTSSPDVWVGLAFGLSRTSSPGVWVGLTFGLSGAVGFYLGFRALFIDRGC
jgi:hypothetical protein